MVHQVHMFSVCLYFYISSEPTKKKKKNITTTFTKSTTNQFPHNLVKISIKKAIFGHFLMN